MKSFVRTFLKKVIQFLSKPVYAVIAICILCSHNLYIKMDTYFLQPNQEATLSLYNGTFEESENIITRDRMLDASVVSHGKRTAIDAAQWKDKDSTVTQLTFNTGKSGTYVAGVSTKARNIELTAEKFNSYLEHDGIVDMLNKRTNERKLQLDAVESYQKHVKAIYQVGDERTNDWNTVLGYPIEFVPIENPYAKFSGETLQFQLLLEGKPVSNQWVYVNHLQHAHDHAQTHSHDDETHTHGDKAHTHNDSDESHTHKNNQKIRTDSQGLVTINLPVDGIYYLQTIHMTEVADSDELTHESKWATLTFEVSHKHGEDTHTHEHDDHEEEGIPTWLFVLGSFLVIVLLFLVFRKKS